MKRTLCRSLVCNWKQSHRLEETPFTALSGKLKSPIQRVIKAGALGADMYSCWDREHQMSLIFTSHQPGIRFIRLHNVYICQSIEKAGWLKSFVPNLRCITQDTSQIHGAVWSNIRVLLSQTDKDKPSAPCVFSSKQTFTLLQKSLGHFRTSPFSIGKRV